METIQSLVASDVTFTYDGSKVDQDTFKLSGQEDVCDNIEEMWARGESDDASYTSEVVEATDTRVAASQEWTVPEHIILITDVLTVSDGEITSWELIPEEVTPR